MKRRTAALLVAAVFAAGVAVGALGMHLLEHHPRWSGGPSGPRSERGDGFADRLRDRLDLTPEQTERIAAIMREARAEARALHERLRPEARALMEQSEQRIREVLTPAQLGEFEKLRAEHRERADLFLLGRGPLPSWLGGRRGHGRGRGPTRDEGAGPAVPGPAGPEEPASTPGPPAL